MNSSVNTARAEMLRKRRRLQDIGPVRWAIAAGSPTLLRGFQSRRGPNESGFIWVRLPNSFFLGSLMSLFCAACVRFLDGCSQTEPHSDLLFRGSTTIHYGGNSNGDEIGCYRHFICRECASLWMQKFGWAGKSEGFRLSPLGLGSASTRSRTVATAAGPNHGRKKDPPGPKGQRGEIHFSSQFNPSGG